MDHQERRISGNHVLKLLLSIICLIPVGASSQTPELTATSSELNIEPNETVSITLSVDAAVDAYYIGLEAVFDPEVFEFESASGAGVMTDGIHVADLLSENRGGIGFHNVAPWNAQFGGSYNAYLSGKTDGRRGDLPNIFREY